MPTTKINLPTQINLDRFISLRAHDLRTPFNHIAGFSKMLLNNMEDSPFTDLQKEDLGTIYRSGMRALSLMNGLINIARINCHDKEVNAREVNIEQLVEQSQAQWEKFNPDSDTQTEYRILASSTTLHADEQLTRQIICGFIAYVAQYCEAKARVTIMIEEEPDWLALTFTSSGTKARHSSEVDLEMFGYVSRAFVEQHGGEVRKAEENDDGAIIQITLPKV